MKARQLFASVILALFAVPALASHCPTDVKAIDAALEAGTTLGDEQLSEVKALRDQGDELHKAGKHGESVEALHKAMEMLGIEHAS